MRTYALMWLPRTIMLGDGQSAASGSDPHKAEGIISILEAREQTMRLLSGVTPRHLCKLRGVTPLEDKYVSAKSRGRRRRGFGRTRLWHLALVLCRSVRLHLNHKEKVRCLYLLDILG